MKTYEEVKKYVKSRLSEQRFYHSECVEENCLELARIYGVDENKARLVGIAHDVAKEMPKEEKIEYIEKNKISVDEIQLKNPGLLHAVIGAKICELEFGFTQDMIEAVSNHTTGKPNMDMLSKILYVGDSTSKDRKYDKIDKWNELAKTNIDLAILECLNISITSCIEKGKLIHIDTIETRNQYIENLSNKSEH